MKSNRISYIDIAKGLGIILVVLGHVNNDQYAIKWIYSFHMPLFFYLSGYTFFSDKNENLQQFIRKKFRNIMIPYFSFALISYFFWLFSEINNKDSVLYKPLIGIIYGVGTIEWMGFNLVLWFLPCLFITLSIFKVLSDGDSRTYKVILILVCLFILFASRRLNIRLPWSIDIVPVGLCFLAAGYCARFVKRSNKSKHWKNLFLLLTLISSIGISMLNVRVDMNSLIYGKFYLFFLAAYTGILLIISISKIIISNRVFEFLGKNSLIIMCTHDPIKRILFKLIPIFLDVNISVIRQSIVKSIIITIIIILIITPIIHIVNKYFPVLLGNKNDNIKR